MSSKRGRNKRAKNVRQVDSVHAPSTDLSIIDKRLNVIPGGRQLERTPPTRTHRPQNSPEPSPAPEPAVKDEPCAEEITNHDGSGDVLQDDRKSIRRSSSTAVSATPGNPDPDVFIQGMQGYRWTDADLQFIYQENRKKQVQQLKEELAAVQNNLKSARQTRDAAVAVRDKIRMELSKVPSCERMKQVSLEILGHSSHLEGLGLKALVANLKLADVLRTTAEEKTEVSRLQAEVETARIMRDKEEELKKDIDRCKESVNVIKVRVNMLLSEVSALESQTLGKKGAPQSTKTLPKVQRGTKPSKSTAASKPPKAQTTPKPPKPGPGGPDGPRRSKRLAAKAEK